MDNFRVWTELKQAPVTQLNSAHAKTHKHDEGVEARQRRNTLLRCFLFGLAKITTHGIKRLFMTSNGKGLNNMLACYCLCFSWHAVLVQTC